MFSVRSVVGPIDPADVPLRVSDTYIQQYVQVAFATLIIYDTIIAMDSEVKYFWKNPRTFVSCVYFMNRYIGIFSALAAIPVDAFRVNETMCLFSLWSVEIANLTTVLLIDYILLMRVEALFSDNKTVALCLRILFGLEAVFELSVIIYITLYEQDVVGGLAEGVTVCSSRRSPPAVWNPLTWGILLAYGLVLMIFSLYKAAEFWRESAGFGGLNLVTVLIQDQVIYFLVVIFCCVSRILAVITGMTSAVSVFLDMMGSTSILCILGSRLLVHMKEVGEREVNGGTSFNVQTISNIEFC